VRFHLTTSRLFRFAEKRYVANAHVFQPSSWPLAGSPPMTVNLNHSTVRTFMPDKPCYVPFVKPADLVLLLHSGGNK